SLQLTGGAVAQSWSVGLFAGDNTTRYNFDLNETLLFAGVQGTPWNPVSWRAIGSGSFVGDTVFAHLTDSQFSFSGFELTMTPNQYDLIAGDGHLDYLEIDFSSDQVQVLAAPVPLPATLGLLLSGLVGLSLLGRYSSSPTIGR